MPKKEFIMRGRTPSGESEVLEFSGHKGNGYAYRLTQFVLYPSTNIGTASAEMCGTITAGKTAIPPTDPDFSNPGLIATFVVDHNASSSDGPEYLGVVNDLFLITQDLILTVLDVNASSDVNWQCRFESVKMSGPQEAATNYKQFAISDD